MRKGIINIWIISGILMIIVCSCYKEQVLDEGEGLSDWTALTHGSSTSPNYDEVFNSDIVHRMDIVIEPDYWEIMVDNLEDIMGTSSDLAKPPGPGQITNSPVDNADGSENPVYVPCSVFWNEIEWYYVGVRFKGNSSLNSAYNSKIYKLPLRLEFDHFDSEYPQVAGQTFYGFQELSLSSNYDDNSLMRKTAADLFREFGVPAPHTSFCRIYIDYGEGPGYFGLYTIVEVVFDTMLEKQFGSNSGNCYKPEGTGASFADGTFNQDDFAKKTNESAGDWSDIENLYSVLHDESRVTSPEEWKNDLETIFDVDGFLRWLAANTTMQNWDTYGIMTHNYYLYHDSADDLIKWIPWDNNEAFQDGKQGGALEIDFSGVGSNWPLIYYIIGQDEYEDIYQDYLVDFITTVFEPSKMQTTYQEQYNLIQPYVTGTDGEVDGFTFLNSSSDFDNALSELKSHVSQRKSVVEGYVN